MRGCHSSGTGRITAPGASWPQSTRIDEEELADWRAGRNAVYQLAALTIGARLAVADA
jgi:hypothetical protein